MECATRYGRIPAAGDIPPERGAAWVTRVQWSAPRPFNPAALTAGAPLQVRADWGRWVVDCPWCGSAQLACRTDPRFMCVECGNAGVGGAYRPVAWPKAAAAIERLLDARPSPRHQNWVPGETVGQLAAENALLGVSA